VVRRFRFNNYLKGDDLSDEEAISEILHRNVYCNLLISIYYFTQCIKNVFTVYNLNIHFFPKIALTIFNLVFY